MRNYPLWKSLLVIIVVITGVIFSIPSIIYSEDSSNWFLQNKINLGLDLQGGAYLLLEVKSEVLLKEEFENISDTVRIISRKNKTNFVNIKSQDDFIEFSKLLFSSSPRSISITFSTPLLPIITGTPAYKFFTPYSPFKKAAQGKVFFKFLI